MKTLLTTLALTLAVSSTAQAGEVYGKITAGTASVGEGTEVSASAEGSPTPR
jgi:hypothetical protein